ncbi:MAG: hypothetical protein NVSMB27_21400 [Ktedonobacteraceae bacterium]
MWTNLGSPQGLASTLYVARNSDGRLDVFCINQAGNILHNCELNLSGSNNWGTNWQMIGNSNDKGVSLDVGQTADGRLEVFLSDNLYNLYYTTQASNWGWWNSIGGLTVSWVPIVALGKERGGQLQAFFAGYDNNIWMWTGSV